MKFPDDAFIRDDESDDTEFYRTDRFVSHLDSHALATIEKIIDDLIVEENPSILDLMASWDSHLTERLKSNTVTGLGLNENELRRNEALDRYVIHDLNRDPGLPFEDRTFDAVLCTVSVDYLTRPLEVFREAGRILKPGGLFLVTFSNRMFPEKAVRIWRQSNEMERLILVEDFFRESGEFDKPRIFVSRGKPRPSDDKYAHLGIPSDPVYAVFANRLGAPAPRRCISLGMSGDEKPDHQQISDRTREIKATLHCPHCGEKMNKWEVPQNIFTQWPNEYMYICFNDECPYFVRGWDAMAAQQNHCSYRLMYDPLTDSCQPVPVYSRKMLREGIIE